VAKNTIIYRKRYALEFLKESKIQKMSHIEKITAQYIISFIKRRSIHYASGIIGVVSASLRSFLKYVTLSGYDVKHLLAAIPRLTNWRLSQVPKSLSAIEINKLLSIFNQEDPSGKRNYAMASFLIDLGLKYCEVSRIKIKDINWHNGVININTTRC
jgi:site-specific recombinase XerD